VGAAITVLSLDKRLQGLFERNKSISLQVSDPFCAIEPGNPDQAVSLFFQRYISPTYVDEGVKVLYWRRRSSGQQIDEQVPWVIEGRLWIPAPRPERPKEDAVVLPGKKSEEAMPVNGVQQNKEE